jgi:hypothetical protein
LSLLHPHVLAKQHLLSLSHSFSLLLLRIFLSFSLQQYLSSLLIYILPYISYTHYSLHPYSIFFSQLSTLLLSSYHLFISLLLSSPLSSPLLLFTNTMLIYSLFLGTLTFKSLFLKNPPVSAVDAEFKGTHDDLPYYSRISLGMHRIPVVKPIG